MGWASNLLYATGVATGKKRWNNQEGPVRLAFDKKHDVEYQKNKQPFLFI